MFVQWLVTPRTRNKFVEIAAVVERYLIITRVKNKESKKQPFRIICLSWLKNNNKKGRNFFVPSLHFCQFRQDGRKSRTFFMKISWIWTCSQIFRKFCYWKNLQKKAPVYLKTLSNNIYTRKGSLEKHLPIQSQQQKQWKKVWIMFKVNNKNTRTTFYCINC